MTGIPRHITEHRLNVRGGCSSVRQKKKGQAADRNQAIQEEVGKLVEARIMKEVHYHEWLSNPMMVKNHDDSLRMCIDFKDLNKACPKDGYPLPEIDWKMPFGLRNVGETYQRLVDKAFHKQIGRNLEVYVDDLVIKSRTEDEIVRDIEETFKTLREINMKFNPKKCNFHWTAEAEEAFKQMKMLIAGLHMLAAPMEREELIVYLAATKETVLSRPEVTGRLQKLSIELGECAIHYRPRVSVKGRILADFIVERPEEDSLDTLMDAEEELPEPWILFTDGSSCTDGSGAGLILTNP
ncbi:reverse transcriptase domain-containing protein [Tanacetum coccineum]|uniref:Reverse transcriptase domain-containing protein n=1 Tax=Tanacetum coccineum TaxID=301880 RepID=A0ABQ5B2S1_9ASTR